MCISEKDPVGSKDVCPRVVGGERCVSPRCQKVCVPVVFHVRKGPVRSKDVRPGMFPVGCRKMCVPRDVPKMCVPVSLGAKGVCPRGVKRCVSLWCSRKVCVPVGFHVRKGPVRSKDVCPRDVPRGVSKDVCPRVVGVERCVSPCRWGRKVCVPAVSKGVCPCGVPRPKRPSEVKRCASPGCSPWGVERCVSPGMFQRCVSPCRWGRKVCVPAVSKGVCPCGVPERCVSLWGSTSEKAQ